MMQLLDHRTTRTRPEAQGGPRSLQGLAGIAILSVLGSFGAAGAAQAAAVTLTQVGPSGEAAARCGGEFTDSKAVARISHRKDGTSVSIRVEDARPDTLYTVWLFLAGNSPLTSKGFTALANPSDLVDLVRITPATTLVAPYAAFGDDGTGSPEAANAFRTNQRGNAFVRFKLDFPLIKGAYQFGEAEEALEQLVGDDVRGLGPVALGVAPGRIFRIDSHCDDDVAHGVTNADAAADIASVAEPWWQLEVNPFD